MLASGLIIVINEINALRIVVKAIPTRIIIDLLLPSRLVDFPEIR